MEKEEEEEMEEKEEEEGTACMWQKVEIWPLVCVVKINLLLPK